MRKVVEAYLQTNLFIKGVGDLGATLTSTTNAMGKIKSLFMEEDGQVLFVTVNGVNIGISWANVKNVIYAPATDKAAKIVGRLG